MQAKVLSTGYNPRPHQEWLHQKLRRFNVILAHRRFGKTVFSINEMVDRGIRCERKNPQVCYVAPTFGAAKRIAWNYLKEFIGHLPGVKFHEGELRAVVPRVRPDGSQDELRIFLLGSENPGALRGLYLDFAVVDEYSESDPTVWTQVIRPALSDRRGGAIFIFTPKGSNHAHKIYMEATKDESGNWYACMFKASETGILPEEELSDARKAMSPEEYDQEFECSFSAALVGAYYKDEMRAAQKRTVHVPYDTHTFVHTGWDLGIDDSTAIWFIQEAGKELHVIDYLEASGKGLPEIFKLLRSKPYSYGRFIFPHDIAVRELGTGKSRLEIIRDKFGIRDVTVAPKLKVEDGIAAVRSIFHRLWFDTENTAYGRECLKAYERVFDAKEGVYRSKPRHNWASHGADALRTFATGYRLSEDRNDGDSGLDHTSQSDYDIMDW